MRYFLDTEFIEDGRIIDLISIGIVAEDNSSLYYVNRECDFSKASDWVLENVLLPIGLDRKGFSRNPGDSDAHPAYRESCLAARDRAEIARLIIEFVNTGCPPSSSLDKPTFWGYYADYDWVVFCQLFGTMMNLPKGFPMYCRDIKQECDRLGNPKLPEQDKNEHHALADAYWNKTTWEFLDKLTRSRNL